MAKETSNKETPNSYKENDFATSKTQDTAPEEASQVKVTEEPTPYNAPAQKEEDLEIVEEPLQSGVLYAPDVDNYKTTVSSSLQGHYLKRIGGNKVIKVDPWGNRVE